MRATMSAAPASAPRSSDDAYHIPTEDDGVRRVVFSVMTATEIRARSACEVTGVDLFAAGQPVDGGLYDTRMGVVEYGQRCGTCRHNNKVCPGHPGHIELAAPVFNTLFLEYTKKVLRCVCFTCARACLPEPFAAPAAPGESALMFATDQAARVKDSCALCGAARPERLAWNKSSLSTFTYHVRNEDGAKELTSTQAYDILRRVPDADCRLIGLDPRRTRPEAFMLEALPVTPVAVRPPHRSGSQRRDDDITHKLSDIVKSNRRVRAKIDSGADHGEVVATVNHLQLDVMQLLENTGTGGLQARMKATNRPLRSIASRLKGKDGRVRNNLLGKRVDFSARSVVSAEPNISVNEVGVPVRIAMTLTFPETVHAGNVERLRRMVVNGPRVYPGARMLRREGVTFSLERPEPRVRTDLRAGDVVERHIIDGDVVLFNRQPSLHRMSMMAHKVKVMPHDTLRLNVLCTEPYNADFDGDETNIHLPQSVATALEIEQLAAVKTQIVSPRHHRPIVGVVQDVALGIYLLTQDGVAVDANTAANVCARCSDTMPTAAMTGKELFSATLPTTLHCAMSGGASVIEHGDLIAGSVGKAQFQQEGCGVLHSVFAEDGVDAAVRLLDNTQWMTCEWLMSRGHSMGAADIVISGAGRAETDRLVADARERVAKTLANVHAGKFVNDSSGSDADALERAIVGDLDAARDAVTRLVTAEGTAAGSRLLSMVQAKSKGNNKNVVQMAGILGQNLIDGGRMPPTMGGRTLPHFQRHDIGADARGFIASSFREGLRPHEFFFHAMAGREGLIDTAVKTADCGYLQRRFVKALEDLQVAGDATVRDAADNIVSFRYGGDGMDACAIQTQRVPTFGGGLEWLAATFLLCREDDPELERVLTAPALTRWRAMTDADLERLRTHLRTLVEDKHFVARVTARDGARLGEGAVAHAIGFERIVTRCARTHNPVQVGSDLDPIAVLDAADSLASDLFPEPGGDRALGAVLVRAHLSPKPLIRAGVTTRAFADILATVRTRFYAGIVSPSEMVGIIAAQSIAEPSTQMTLNSFAYDTPLLLDIGGRLVREDIGAFVDAKIAFAADTDLEYHANDTILAWLRSGAIRVPSCDDVGAIAWRRVEAVTRHPVINEDGSDTLLRVTLHSGRELVATKAKSFLKRIDNRIVPVDGSEIRVDDYLPVTRRLEPPPDGSFTRTDLERHAQLDARCADHDDTVPDISTRQWGTFTAKRADVPGLRAIAEHADDRAVLDRIIDGEDVFYDRIVSIEEVSNAPRRWVYDLTVEGTRNFSTYTGIAVRDSFHSTGAANKASIPRVKELVAVTKNPKRTTYEIKLLPGTDESAEFAGAIRDRLLCTHVRDLVARTRMTCETGSPSGAGGDARLRALETLLDDGSGRGGDIGTAANAGGSGEVRFVLRIELDRERLAEHAVSTLDVHAAIFSGVHASVVAADDAAEELLVRVTPDIKLAESHDIVAELREMETRILGTRIKGVAGITGCDVIAPKTGGERVYDPIAADYIAREAFTLEAIAGADASVHDLVEISDIPGVDIINTHGDNVWHTFDLLGIEAARTLLLRELQGAYADDNTYADFRHIELLVDFITRRGVLTAVTRHGVQATDAGPLTKASFEQTVQKLVQAGAFGEVDNMTGVSANVMLGQTVPCGTGSSKILWDASMAADLPDGETLPLSEHGSGVRAFRITAIVEYTPFTEAQESIPAIAPAFASSTASTLEGEGRAVVSM